MQRANSKSAAEAGAVTSGLGEMFPLVCHGLGGDEASPSGELEKREKGKKTKSPPIAYTHADQKSFPVFLFPGQSHSAGAVSHAKALPLALPKCPT